ncbi:PepSY-associated TM helix domain-containing protein [Pedobacter nototheniae]|uniref:PepSY-associated TM helix domain-containing protein n=1 Tax=Pedobacter nototheniae TaxID=2488994 RepID=UPI00292FECBE|nr:PepSY-associated TM helix domain-containing protein [Pedobacter nototheniae]
MKRKFKNTIRQIHLWLGLATGLVVIVIGITGSLYVFEEEIRALTQKEFRLVPEQNKPFAGLDKIIINFDQLATKDKIRGIRINEQIANATVEVTTKKNQVYYYNPYTAALVKKGGLDWLEVVQHIHTSLLLGKTGEFIIRWSVVIFVLMLLTGLILWFPGQMRLLKQSLTIKRNASFKRLNYDLHNVLGFYASIVLLVTALSGLYFAFKEVKTVASFLTGTKLSAGNKVIDSKPVELNLLPERYQEIYRVARLKYPGAIATNFSLRAGGELRLRMIYPYSWARKQNTFFYKEENGKMLREKLYIHNNGADLIEATNYDLHTGKLLGLPGKILTFMAGLIAASLPVTGFIIWLKKRKKPAKKRSIKAADKFA